MPVTAQHLDIDGKHYVLLPEADYELLCGRAGEAIALDESDLPALPKPDKKGRFPALEYTRIALARDIIRDRKAARLTQTKLAELAGIRQETLSRIESGKHKASVKTIEKIDQILRKKLRGKKGK
ncbi:MAG: helix-turn-helix transcriptional regulator [Planctomycetes bacterium]|nr:helix-turn-helix transcriptional regulator [Planctomycetota bacterium]